MNCCVCSSEKNRNILKEYTECLNCGLIYSNSFHSSSAMEYEAGYKNDIYLKSKGEIFNFVLNQLNKNSHGRSKLLDIGAAYGDFMSLASKDGWEVEGIEISEIMVKEAKKKGHEIYDKSLSALNLPKQSYGAITLLEVLSQVENPLKTMKEVYSVLKPGGVIVLREFNSTFHFNSFLRFIFGILKISPFVFHSWNFNKCSLNYALKKSGFEDIKILNSMPSLGDPYNTGDFLGKFGVSFFKFLYYYFSEGVYFLSFKKIVIAPSFFVIARK